MASSHSYKYGLGSKVWAFALYASKYFTKLDSVVIRF
jgi:hypothetical protein